MPSRSELKIKGLICTKVGIGCVWDHGLCLSRHSRNGAIGKEGTAWFEVYI